MGEDSNLNGGSFYEHNGKVNEKQTKKSPTASPDNDSHMYPTSNDARIQTVYQIPSRVMQINSRARSNPRKRVPTIHKDNLIPYDKESGTVGKDPAK